MCPRSLVAAAIAWLIVLPAGPASIRLEAQHETAFDIEDGGRAFSSSCANCHGPDGDAIAGIDLGRGQFRRPLTDADLVRIIRNGIPNTPMPASNVSEEQAARIVAYLRSVAASRRSVAAGGDPVRGRALFEGKGGCDGCHRVGSAGSPIGPDLSRIGQLRRAAEIEESLLDPDAEVLPVNRSYRVVTREGESAYGRLLNLDTFTVQLLDSAGRLRSFDKAGLQQHGFAPTPMPAATARLDPQDIADIVSYLVSLKGGEVP